ncbi:hypothetical protein CXG81DRAFT_13573 [Caulochytrium protostelioides]|uniref:Calcium-activated potassium channel BK alpha subunit domain-containing protein n=1 Tax=Caulochytrium protostelioides TaxID=1555241 RepID=A0A4P9WVJ2_9FUNG|nr:hypothetical protein CAUPRSCDRAFT_6654 [Caulochytrium protostelioides]RKP00134.1 hypothetical protein CXG81DRAFT_13573 [Caulochytrium protostelioides]|eukprot:RKP00134.1 hypothetical protein CXG81DRAFT_13573 [Caulochytrium protostelioides]
MAPGATTTPLVADAVNGSTSTRTTIYSVILWSPFILIPACIVGVRITKLLYRYYYSRKSSQEGDEVGITDPLGELGRAIGVQSSSNKHTRRIRKEQLRLKRWAIKRSPAKPASYALYEAGISRPDVLNGNEDESADAPPPSAFDVFRQRTRSGWRENWSPEAMRKIISTTRFGRLWMVFQMALTVAAITNYIVLTYTIGNADRSHIEYLDAVIAICFLADYVLGIYVAQDRLAFYFSLGAMVDLVSSVPPLIYILISDALPYIWFLGLLRILRASRILRTYRLLSFSESEERRELTILALSFINFVFLSASIVNALETLHEESVPPSLTRWHDSLYYIMVTFSTIGFGDLTPSSSTSRLVVMVLIIIVIIWVPIQTGRLADIYKSSSPFQRAAYHVSSSNSHVILTGSISYTAVIDFCREYFYVDEEGHVVILTNSDPTLEIKKLLRHPFYRGRVVWLNGSPLSVTDLRRTKLDQATGVFLLNANESGGTEMMSGATEEEELQVTRGQDADILMQALIIKRSFPAVPLYAQVQDIRSQDLSAHCGCDRTLCVDEIKMALIALNCLVPGALTLVLNIVHTYKEDDAPPGIASTSWLKDYNAGASHQICTLRVPKSLVGSTFSQIVRAIYRAFDVLVFGISSPLEGKRLHINADPNQIVHSSDILFCFADGGDEVILRIGFYFQDLGYKPDSIAADSSHSLASLIATGHMSPEHAAGHHHRRGVPGGRAQPSDGDAAAARKRGHIILCGNTSARSIRHFVMSMRQSIMESRDMPIVVLMEHPPAVAPEGQAHRGGTIWQDIVNFGGVTFLKGTPLKRTSLQQASIETCTRIVIFTSSANRNGPHDTQLCDANAIFIYKMIAEQWPHVSYCIELVNAANTKYFARLESGPDHLAVQSVLSNDALSLGDRLMLYRTIREKRLRADENFFHQLIEFTKGEGVGGIPSLRHSSKQPPAPLGKGDSMPLLMPNDVEATGLDASPPGGARPGMRVKTVYDDGPGSKRSPIHVPSDEDEDDEDEDLRDADDDGAAGGNAYIRRLQDTADINESGLSAVPVYHFSPEFAAGCIIPHSFMHSLLAQTYFRPYIIDVVRVLCSSIRQVHPPPDMWGRTYGDLVVRWSLQGVLPVGLYRRALRQSEGESPYVHTNPPKGTVICRTDYVYVLVSTV